MSLLRFPRLHSAVIRTFVLVQHYAAAMMAVSGLSQMKSYTSVETLEITQNLLNSPRQCPCGHGLMVLLRVPCSPLAALAYERLAHVRARLALEQHFEIILGNPSSGLTVGKHFVKQLKVGALVGGRRGDGGLGVRGEGRWTSDKLLNFVSCVASLLPATPPATSPATSLARSPPSSFSPEVLNYRCYPLAALPTTHYLAVSNLLSCSVLLSSWGCISSPLLSCYPPACRTQMGVLSSFSKLPLPTPGGLHHTWGCFGVLCPLAPPLGDGWRAETIPKDLSLPH